MPVETKSKPSFSPYRKWSMGLRVALLVILVLAVVVMVNYISQAYFLRFYLGARGKSTLSPRTLSLLGSLTNQVKITVYYDQGDLLYSSVADLVNEYKQASPKISVQTVDYERDPISALQLKERHPWLATPAAKNLVIFECGEKTKAVEGNLLAKYVLEQVQEGGEDQLRRRPTAFLGELYFTAALLDVINPKPLKAYFLTDEGEHSFQSDDKALGYSKFASLLEQNYIAPTNLSLLGTNSIPMDCNLLVIAGPAERLTDGELGKVEQYLNEGGRLLLLFNNFTTKTRDTGLEPLLGKWGVHVSLGVVRDPENTTQRDLSDMKVKKFGQHPLINPLLEKQLHLILPRAVGKYPASTAPGTTKVDELAFSGPQSYPDGAPNPQRAFPLMVAVEKAALKGVITERGTTRMVVAGDSMFLGNYYIESAANRQFAGCVANWLLDRTQLLADIPPRPFAEYRNLMTQAQMKNTELVLLGGAPGGVLLLGTLVWLRRRR
jgi:hypothetical protein